MPHDEYPDPIGIHDAKQDGIRKSVNDAAPNLCFDQRELHGVARDSLDDCVDFSSEFGIQPWSGTPVMGGSFIDVVGGRGVKLDLHSPVARVRRWNSS